jgi:hypothetical protein
VSGPTSKPAVSVDRSKLTLDGRSPPRSRSLESLSGLLHGGSAEGLPLARIIEALRRARRSADAGDTRGPDGSGRLLDILHELAGPQDVPGDGNGPGRGPPDRRQRIRENLERILRDRSR